MKNKHAHNRILLLIILSACVHVIFLYNPKNKIELPSQQASNFTVQLHTVYPKTHKNKHAKLKNKPAKKETLAKQVIPDSHENKQNTIAESSKVVRAKLLTQIKTTFTKHFEYPNVAQRKGWQGKVLLAFNINKQGNISDIHIKNSSGYAVLDQAAHHSLSQIKKITVNNWPFTIKQAFKLPVIYKLYEG